MADAVGALPLPAGYNRIRRVESFAALAAASLDGGVNALVWERALPGDFGEVVGQLGAGDGIMALDEARLRGLRLSATGQQAVAVLIDDLRRLRALERDPELNCIHAYPRDDEPGPVATDVFSFHADRAPVPADTWLCTYHGAPSEGLRNDEARKRADDPTTRAALLREYGGADDAEFTAWLADHSYDLHYAALPGATPWSFGVGHLWRICTDYPGSPVPPCIHRAPETVPGQRRLLLIA